MSYAVRVILFVVLSLVSLGSVRAEEETKKFDSSDSPGIFPFEFAFRYPRSWNNFEFLDDELVSSSKDTRMRFASYVNIEYLSFNGLKPLMQSNSEEMERHLIKTVLENSEEKKEFPNCVMTVDTIGNYPVGVITLDYTEMKRGRKLFFQVGRFVVPSRHRVLAFTVAIIGLDNPENKKSIEAEFNRYNRGVREIIETLEFGDDL